jgi:hypothetical protein
MNRHGARDYRLLGRVVGTHRRALGLRQEDLAELTGLTSATLRALQNGHRVAPTSGTLGQLEAGLGWVPGSADRVAAGGHPYLVTAKRFGTDLVCHRNDLGYGERDVWCATFALDPALITEAEQGKREVIADPDRQTRALPAAEGLAIDSAYGLAPGTARRFINGDITTLVFPPAPARPGDSDAAGPMTVVAMNGVQSLALFEALVRDEMTQHGDLPRFRDNEEERRWWLYKQGGMPDEELVGWLAWWRMRDAAASAPPALTPGPGLLRSA